LVQDRHLVFGNHRRIGWIWCAAILLFAFVIERRIPSLSFMHPTTAFRNWSRTIGELAPVSPLDAIWFRWTGYMIVIVPALILWNSFIAKLAGHRPKGNLPIFLTGLLLVTYCLTIWQARWSYFFVVIFVLVLPRLLEPIKFRAAVWFAILLSMLPILRDWDETIWPNDPDSARVIERRREAIELREIALNLMSSQREAFLAPWWLSPSIAYWSGQPGVAGSSHESLPGIMESAEFFLTEDMTTAREILRRREVVWVVAYDADRVEANAAALLGREPAHRSFARLLDRKPAQVAPFLLSFAQNGTAKLFRVVNPR
ncbi:MAG: hypothetical protein QOI34_1377, partial [Verrucomicrobiota bacterium]